MNWKKILSVFAFALAAIHVTALGCSKSSSGGSAVDFTGTYSGTGHVSFAGVCGNGNTASGTLTMTLTHNGSNITGSDSNSATPVVSGTTNGNTAALAFIGSGSACQTPPISPSATCTLSGSSLSCAMGGTACSLCGVTETQTGTSTLTKQ